MPEENCGPHGRQAHLQIVLPPDETVSFRSPEGRRRWFIRRRTKVTFTVLQGGRPSLVMKDDTIRLSCGRTNCLGILNGAP